MQVTSDVFFDLEERDATNSPIEGPWKHHAFINEGIVVRIVTRFLQDTSRTISSARLVLRRAQPQSFPATRGLEIETEYAISASAVFT